MTSANTSDVDISIHASGVFKTASEKGWRYFPTTIDEFTTSSRVPLWGDKLAELGPGVKEFYDKWDEIHWGGLQVSAYESDNRLPPWESRAVYGQ